MQALYQLILTLRIQVPKIEARFYAVMPRWIGYFTATDFAGFLGACDRRQAYRHTSLNQTISLHETRGD